MNPEESTVEFVECRHCKQGVLSVYKFCGGCGNATAHIDLDREMMKDYCGRCGSVLRGLKKYCSQCGDEVLAGAAQNQHWLLKLLQNPRLQVSLAGVMLAIVALPLVSPVRYGLSSAPPFVNVYVEDGPDPERLALQVSRRSWSIRELDLGDDTVADASGVAADGLGNFYVSDSSRHAIFRISASGAAELFAGGAEAGFAGDEGPAVDARFNHPRGLAIDSGGHLFVADSGNNRVRMIDPDGRVFTVAGCGDCKSSSTEDHDAKKIRLLNPAAVAFSGDDLLVAEAPGGAGAPRPPTVWSLQPKR